MIHRMVARAAMTPASPMQRKAVGRALIAVRAILRPILPILTLRAIRTIALLRGLLLRRLAAGNE